MGWTADFKAIHGFRRDDGGTMVGSFCFFAVTPDCFLPEASGWTGRLPAEKGFDNGEHASVREYRLSARDH